MRQPMAWDMLQYEAARGEQRRVAEQARQAAQVAQVTGATRNRGPRERLAAALIALAVRLDPSPRRQACTLQPTAGLAQP